MTSAMLAGGHWPVDDHGESAGGALLLDLGARPHPQLVAHIHHLLLTRTLSYVKELPPGNVKALPPGKPPPQVGFVEIGRAHV